MSNRQNMLVVLLLAVPVVALAALLYEGSDGAPEFTTTLSVSDVMGQGVDDRYARALEPRPFTFPPDHGPHPAFQTEWWYLTGNLESEGGSRFGFQFTIFRSALTPDSEAGDPGSEWETNQIYMGHLALTDESAETFHHFERFSRGALGLAGAQISPFRVWLEDWGLEGPGEFDDLNGEGLFPLRLSGAEDGTGISLTLTPRKPKVLQGDRGLSQKGAEPGNASYYYSFTRLDVEGAVLLDGEEAAVRGQAWFDREWSTSALSTGQVGWDWFALQLDDGRDLMYYQLRLEDGEPDPLSKGILVEGDGSSTLLRSGDVDLAVLERWTSPVGGVEYPSAWRLLVPDQDVELEVRPVLPDQELVLTFRYWEGAVDISGTGPDGPVTGRGYVELTGYADRASRGGEPAGR